MIIKRLREILLNNPIIKPLVLLISGSTIAQAIAFLLAPVITRLFTPSEMGVYTLLATAVAQFGPIISLKYDMGIILAKTETEANIAGALSLAICFILSTLIAVIYSLFSLEEYKSTVSFFTGVITIFLLLVASGLIVILSAYSNRNKEYRSINRSNVMRSLASNLLLVVNGSLGLSIFGIIISHVFAEFLGVVILLKKKSKAMLHSIKSLKLSSLAKYFVSNRKYPIYNASAALITTSVYSIINWFIISMYTSEELGLYSISYRILGIPFTLISANIAKLYFKHASDEKKEKGNFYVSYKKTLRLLIFIIIPLILLICTLSPFLIETLLGSNWTNASVYIMYLSPMLAAKLIGESLITTYTIAGRQRLEFIMQSLLLIVELIVLSTLRIRGAPIVHFLITISSVYVLFYLFSLFIMLKLSKGGNND